MGEHVGIEPQRHMLACLAAERRPAWTADRHDFLVLGQPVVGVFGNTPLEFGGVFGGPATSETSLRLSFDLVAMVKPPFLWAGGAHADRRDSLPAPGV